MLANKPFASTFSGGFGTYTFNRTDTNEQNELKINESDDTQKLVDLPVENKPKEKKSSTANSSRFEAKL